MFCLLGGSNVIYRVALCFLLKKNQNERQEDENDRARKKKTKIRSGNFVALNSSESQSYRPLSCLTALPNAARVYSGGQTASVKPSGEGLARCVSSSGQTTIWLENCNAACKKMPFL